MNIPILLQISECLESHQRPAFDQLIKGAFCHQTQQALFIKYHKQCPDLTSVVIVNFSIFNSYQLVATFKDGTRREYHFQCDQLAEWLYEDGGFDAILNGFIQDYEYDHSQTQSGE